ncbi:TonB family protein [Hymenobacter sp. 5516J-16]|uniref:TonB family protein n=2 Tax=Hymenobacter TaxID=89966 RepID=A0ABY4J9E2_9BACT|nr:MULTISPECIES: energy transducer TonB [Hymenobacter]UOQ75757.1 TonB family protein [Hymenobacter sp. 5516J-16]UPL49432.1 TonB family protein [Hymenobacter sublimis]GGG46427.1 cell envelope biogenesis protein TonB [Hymenobacter glacieicola]
MMDNSQLAKASLDDIVFEGRNKAYGAYVIRRVYGKHVTRAVLIAVALFALMIAFPLVARMMKKDEVVEDEKMLKVNVLEAPPLDATKPPPPPPPPPDAPPPPPPKLSTIKFVPPVVKKDEEVQKQEEIPDQEELKDKVVANETVKGNTDNPADLAGLEPGEGTKAVEEVVETKPYTYVEQMPVFPGGQEALLQYIAKNIKYPAMALRNQVEGRVFIKFVVGPDGAVTNAEVQKGIGAGCDEESLRVIKNLPRFTPGKQNGRAVSVYYTVPVTFAIK